MQDTDRKLYKINIDFDPKWPLPCLKKAQNSAVFRKRGGCIALLLLFNCLIQTCLNHTNVHSYNKC